MKNPQNDKISNPRTLRREEKDILFALLDGKFDTNALKDLITNMQAIDLQDGGMGSIRLVTNSNNQAMGCVLAEAEYSDADGILVSLCCNGDQSGKPYELDFWKVDFSSLKRYPKPDELKIIS